LNGTCTCKSIAPSKISADNLFQKKTNKKNKKNLLFLADESESSLLIALDLEEAYQDHLSSYSNYKRNMMINVVDFLRQSLSLASTPVMWLLRFSGILASLGQFASKSDNELVQIISWVFYQSSSAEPATVVSSSFAIMGLEPPSSGGERKNTRYKPSNNNTNRTSKQIRKGVNSLPPLFAYLSSSPSPSSTASRTSPSLGFLDLAFGVFTSPSMAARSGVEGRLPPELLSAGTTVGTAGSSLGPHGNRRKKLAILVPTPDDSDHLSGTTLCLHTGQQYSRAGVEEGNADKD
jgi:hypothetical protein